MLIYAICLPLAIYLGYLITDPLDRTTDFTVGMVFFLMLLPLLLRWYHAWLIVIWNMSMSLMFLPGILPAWMPVAVIAFGVAVGHYVLNRERKFLHAPSLSWSLVFLAIVVAVTAGFRGGIGFRAFGNEAIGGKRYLWIWIAVLGYFALISQRIPPQKRRLYTTLFLLAAATQLINEMSPYLGPVSSFVYMFFPGAPTGNGPISNVGQVDLQRLGGLAAAGMAIAFALIARYGIEGLFDFKRLWRMMLFVSAIVACGLGGFRSLIILAGMTILLVFFLEGLVRTRLMPIALLGVVLMSALTVSFSDRLPLSIQRCLAIFPVKIDPVARMSAESSTTWRLEIWQSLLPQVPRYLFLGKGLIFDSNDLAMYLTLSNQLVEGDVGGEFTLAGDYHNGPLSVIIPFGIWGAIAFIWFLVASMQVLWRNYKYADPEIQKINTFLLGYFIAKIIGFFVIFGGFYADLFTFVGIVGFSISLNGGVAQASPAPVRSQVVFNRFRPLPAVRPANGT